MTEQHNVWRATGLYWHSRTPGIGLVDLRGVEHTEPIPLGAPVGYQVGAARSCVGVWSGAQLRRQPCPFAHPILPQTTRAQCEPCAATDPGQMLARNITVDDGRDYTLYLAWFGPGLTKVGLTATDRGSDRLAEQGALTFTWLARGCLPAVRAAEQHISAAGLAPQRRQRRAKLAAWWRLPDEAHRRYELQTAYQQIRDAVRWPASLDREPCTVIDQVELFGLDVLPGSCQEITMLTAGAVLRGTVRCAAGRELLLDTSDGPLLIDARLLAGWPVQHTTAAPTGLDTRTCEHAQSNHVADQASLF